MFLRLILSKTALIELLLGLSNWLQLILVNEVLYLLTKKRARD